MSRPLESLVKMALASGGRDSRDHDTPHPGKHTHSILRASSVGALQHLAVIRERALGAATPRPWCLPTVMAPKPELIQV